MASSGLHNVKLYMKKLYRFLVATEYSREDYDGLFAFSISRESKLYPAVSHEEVNRTLDIIDRRTPQGKRNYAMVLLGAVTGLRVVDGGVKYGRKNKCKQSMNSIMKKEYSPPLSGRLYFYYQRFAAKSMNFQYISILFPGETRTFSTSAFTISFGVAVSLSACFAIPAIPFAASLSRPACLYAAS